MVQETSTFTQNGAPSPPMPDERDLMIGQLMSQINQLKQELASVRAEVGLICHTVSVSNSSQVHLHDRPETDKIRVCPITHQLFYLLPVQETNI